MKRETARGLRWLLIPAGAVLLAFLLNSFLILNVRVPSGSMEPTVPSGALVLGFRPAYRTSSPAPGDIVLFRHREIPGRLLLKRVIAVGGQRFMMQKGVVYIDGQPLSEDYILPDGGDYPETLVPEGMLFLLGDHRGASRDSRFWEDPFVPVGAVEAKAVFCYYPVFRSLRRCPSSAEATSVSDGGSAFGTEVPAASVGGSTLRRSLREGMGHGLPGREPVR